MKLINIYCDESCHLESSIKATENQFMVLGSVACPDAIKKEIFQEIKTIKRENNLREYSEVKWTKVTRNKIAAYEALINYFFSCEELSFRAIVIDKQQLQHNRFNHSHDQFYYKMYWQMLEWFIDPENTYHIYLDIKDTRGYLKVEKLHEVLCNSHHDFNKKIVEKIQEIRSHENVLIQLADILIGSISYANRYPEGGLSYAKQRIVNLVKTSTGLSLVRSTSLGARKFNLLNWEGRL
ncbi:DUF3800 domain-containing protein [Legionella quinlivanii]|uniref:DUF3800 domain-containing protein n=1 Tax=Legionella quinlivanii TaxID=45073 RepID=UPI0022439E29|nr:DUF3800 domain-containing protein [Legionella quinlivanii]MCW8452119.1 DUF3800 domain-containing protein [Legionella quinlivanii]